MEKLAELLKDVKISFRLSARPNDITERRAKLLKKIGTTIVGIGAESADESSLKLFNKGLSISSSDKAISILGKNKIVCLVNFIMFNPIINLKGLKVNCDFVERHVNDSIFHRINSHLWIRSTDPIVGNLVELGLCNRNGFPYIECEYKYGEVTKIQKLFDQWCGSNMKRYYNYADVLMAKGIYGNELIYEEYKKMLQKDLEVLKTLIMLCENEELEQKGCHYLGSMMQKNGV